MPAYEVIVVGLGAVGSAATWHLARLGTKVLGIVASPCSGRGFKHSAAIGEALADRLRNRPAKVDLSPFDLRHIS